MSRWQTWSAMTDIERLRTKRSPGRFARCTDRKADSIRLWTQKEIMQLLGPADGAAFCSAYGVKESGNYREQATGELNGSNILHLPAGWPQIPAGRLAVMKL